MPNRYGNEIKIQIWVLVALGFGFVDIKELMEERKAKNARSGDAQMPAVPGEATISRWIKEYKDQRIKDELRNESKKFTLFESLVEEWDAFNMPDGVLLDATGVLMEFKEWIDYPMDSRFEPFYYATHFYKELARWIYLILSAIPKEIGIVESQPSYEQKETVYHLGAVEKDEILLWAEKLMYFDLAHRFLNADKPTGIVEAISRKFLDDPKEWKYKIYKSLKLEVLAFRYGEEAGIIEGIS